jgi:hypothetical protein
MELRGGKILLESRDTAARRMYFQSRDRQGAVGRAARDNRQLARGSFKAIGFTGAMLLTRDKVPVSRHAPGQKHANVRPQIRSTRFEWSASIGMLLAGRDVGGRKILLARSMAPGHVLSELNYGR